MQKTWKGGANKRIKALGVIYMRNRSILLKILVRCITSRTVLATKKILFIQLR